jgi:hypothetical protein
MSASNGARTHSRSPTKARNRSVHDATVCQKTRRLADIHEHLVQILRRKRHRRLQLRPDSGWAVNRGTHTDCVESLRTLLPALGPERVSRVPPFSAPDTGSKTSLSSADATPDRQARRARVRSNSSVPDEPVSLDGCMLFRAALVVRCPSMRCIGSSSTEYPSA